MKSLHLTQIL